MKKIIFVALGAAALFASSCKKDIKSEDLQKPLNPGATVDTLVGNITVNTTLTKTTYLQGIVFVDSLVTLTVPAGTTIIGSPGATLPDLNNLANNKGVLIVRRGGKLIANGTATSPIVWTSSKPSGTRSYGDWGGIVILGAAPIKTTAGNTTNTFEAFSSALPADLPKFNYGGTNAADNSGSMRYNRIEFPGGVVLAANQEVNGLTLCGVGSGTTLDYIQVSNSGDDAFEFFGGRVNAKHLVSFGNKDDDYDFDEAYTGNLQYLIAFRNDLADNSGSEFVESDNNSGAVSFFPGTNFTRATIANATFIGPHSLAVRAGSGGRFDGARWIRRNSRINLANSLIISDSLPCAIGTTATTGPNFDALVGAVDASNIKYNIFQTYSLTPVIRDANEANPIVGVADAALITELSQPAQFNSVLATPAAFLLDAFLKPLPGSPALTGGLSLTGLIPFFTSTTQRGAVTTTDPWTSIGSWLSTAIN
ncbi:MAG: hypothetical protein ACKVOW_00235 [Chitinophagaceae bacterium]